LRVVFHVQHAAVLLGSTASHLTEQPLKAQLEATDRRITTARSVKRLY
jgi:hypothetical protein